MMSHPNQQDIESWLWESANILRGPVVIESVVEKVDSLVQPVRGTGWQTSHPGDRMVRQELRLILKNSGLPPAGDLFDRAYAYIQENY